MGGAGELPHRRRRGRPRAPAPRHRQGPRGCPGASNGRGRARASCGTRSRAGGAGVASRTRAPARHDSGTGRWATPRDAASPGDRGRPPPPPRGRPRPPTPSAPRSPISAGTSPPLRCRGAQRTSSARVSPRRPPPHLHGHGERGDGRPPRDSWPPRPPSSRGPPLHHTKRGRAGTAAGGAPPGAPKRHRPASAGTAGTTTASALPHPTRSSGLRRDAAVTARQASRACWRRRRGRSPAAARVARRRPARPARPPLPPPPTRDSWR